MKIIVLFFILQAYSTIGQKINVQELKCLVCKQTVEELSNAVNALDPSKKVDVGGYRLDGEGNFKHKTISQKKSELKLSELVEQVCEKMDDYVRAFDKTTEELLLFKLMTNDGKMNPKMSEVDIVQDDDLNKSLKYNCEVLVEEHEEEIIQLYKQEHQNIENEVCVSLTNLCPKNNEEL
ncbi:unnamed protein product [Brassicogethes aeneus]|uniref:Saposin B-type domain-containing protein n=1 Tax=Brassicogethes aeneus TaxID=1431903 RepID=A0A9P0AUM3_BRAAE|nr:unnamed protein product [Brassicogethes aeneus]